MKTDKLRKLAQELREKAEQQERRKIANTARVTSGMLGLTHLKRKLRLPLGDTP